MSANVSGVNVSGASVVDVAATTPRARLGVFVEFPCEFVDLAPRWVA